MFARCLPRVKGKRGRYFAFATGAKQGCILTRRGISPTKPDESAAITAWREAPHGSRRDIE
jgi:hypothetical protein